MGHEEEEEVLKSKREVEKEKKVQRKGKEEREIKLFSFKMIII
jgi:hypothetical protein